MVIRILKVFFGVVLMLISVALLVFAGICIHLRMSDGLHGVAAMIAFTGLPGFFFIKSGIKNVPFWDA